MATPSFSGELQFAGYTDSSRNGPRVTFRLADRDELGKFVGLEGKRLAAVLAVLDDDETPESFSMAEHGPQAEPEAPSLKGGPLARLAGIWCADKRFQNWVRAFYEVDCIRTLEALGGEADAEAVVTELLRFRCGISSRAELDHRPEAKKAFDLYFRIPYQRHAEAAPG